MAQYKLIANWQPPSNQPVPVVNYSLLMRKNGEVAFFNKIGNVTSWDSQSAGVPLISPGDQLVVEVVSEIVDPVNGQPLVSDPASSNVVVPGDTPPPTERPSPPEVLQLGVVPV